MILLLIIFHQGFFSSKPSNIVILFLFISLMILFYIRIKHPKLLDLTLQAIIVDDCDANLWLMYLKKYNKNRSMREKIEYASALNYIGEFEQAYILLTSLDTKKIRTIETYLSHIMIMNETCFYLKDLTKLKQLAKIIAEEKSNNTKISGQLNYLKNLNQSYISCINGEHVQIDEIKILIDTSSKMIEKVKLTYFLYVVTYHENKSVTHEKAANFILNNGGTTFFVGKIKTDLLKYEEGISL